LGLLGVGAFGVVIEALNNNTKEYVAVKIIS
jgi:serine/threonine protein kinase